MSRICRNCASLFRPTGWSHRKRFLAAAIALFFFGGLAAFGILIHLKKDNKTTTVEVPEGATVRVAPQGAVTVELPSSGAGPKSASDTVSFGIRLTDAVRAFNSRFLNDLYGKGQPPLTEDEVVTAIRWALVDPRGLHFSDETLRTLREIAETRLLPPGFDIDAVPNSNSNDRIEAQRWLVWLRVPPSRQSALNVNIRWRLINSRRYGDEERKVLQKWRKEHPNGGRDSIFERELAKSREIDRSKAKLDPRPASKEPPAENMTSLEEALRIFNAHAADDSVGKNQPPLTADEVIAAIRWFLVDPSKSPVTDKTLAALEQATRTRLLPPGFEFEVITHFLPNNEMEATIWSVRLRIPAKPDGWTTCVELRWQPVTSRMFGEEERKVVEKWQKKWANDGRSFSDREYENERAKAREIDRAKREFEKPPRTASQSISGSNSSALAFGPVTHHLQAALELKPAGGQFACGQPIGVSFHIRNSSSKPAYTRELSSLICRDDDELVIEDAQGRKVEVHHIMHTGRRPQMVMMVNSGETKVIRSASLAFVPEYGDAEKFAIGQELSYYAMVKPGKYSVRFRLHFPAKGSNMGWQGDLETAPVTVEVMAGTTARAEKAPESISKSAPGKISPITVSTLGAAIAEAQAQAKKSAIWVKYTISEYETPLWTKLMYDALSGKSTEQADPLAVTYDTEAEWALKGDRIRTSFTGPLLYRGSVLRNDVRRIFVYDGEKTVLIDGDSTGGPNSAPIFKVSNDPKKAWGYEAPEGITQQGLLLFYLGNWQSHKDVYKVAIKNERDREGPVTLMELRLSRDNSLLLKARLLPGPGLLVKRLETYYLNGKLARQSTDVQYQELDGLRYPKSAVFREYSEDGDFLRERKLHVNSVTMRASEIPDSLFKLEIPPGAAVYDLDQQTWGGKTNRVPVSSPRVPVSSPDKAHNNAEGIKAVKAQIEGKIVDEFHLKGRILATLSADVSPEDAGTGPASEQQLKKAGGAADTYNGDPAAPQGANPADSFQARWESLRHRAPPESHGRPMKMVPEEIGRFARLPEERQKAAMIEGIKKIQRAFGNVSLSTTTCISKVGDPRKSDGKAVTMLAYGEFGTHVYDLRRIGRSYRVETAHWYPSRQHRKPQMDVRNYDAESGVGRVLLPESRADGTERNHARIEREPFPNVGAECSYAAYLGGFEPSWDDYYKILIDHQGALRVRGVDQQTRLVEVGFAFTDERRKEAVSGTAWLDLGKDWMLRKMRQEAKGVGTERGREDYGLFEAEGSELIDGVWMPTSFIEYFWSRDDSFHKPEDPFSSKDRSSETSMGNLRETIAENIKLGSVKKEDLAVDFPPGTVVDDCITGDRWTVGPTSKRTHVSPKDTGGAEAEPGPPKDATSGLYFKIYPVGDLVAPRPAVVNMSEQAAMPQFPANLRASSLSPEFQRLADSILEKVAPETWLHKGGKGTIDYSPANLCLVINQSEKVHQKIADFLEDLRRRMDVRVCLQARYLMAEADVCKRLGVNVDSVTFTAGQARDFQERAGKTREAHEYWPDTTLLLDQAARYPVPEGGAFQVRPVVSADRSAVRMTCTFKPDDKAGEELPAITVPDGDSTVINLSRLMGHATAKKTTPEGSHLLLMLTPRIVVAKEEKKIDVPVTDAAGAAKKPLHRFDPGFPVGAIAISPDGKLIAAAGDGNDGRPAAKVLDAATGKTVAALKLAAKEEEAFLADPASAAAFRVSALAFSPNGKLLAVGTELGQVKLCDPQSGELLRTLDDEKVRIAEKRGIEKWKLIKRAMGGVESLAFSPDGKALATSGKAFGDYSDAQRSIGPTRLKLWDVKSGTIKEDLAGNLFPCGVAFSPDGRWLANAGGWAESRDSGGIGAILWNLEAGKPARRFIKIAECGYIHGVAFSPDGKLLAIGTVEEYHDKVRGESYERGRVDLIHTATGIMARSIVVPVLPKWLAISPDGETVVVCDRYSVRFLDAGIGLFKNEIHPGGPNYEAQWNDFSIAATSGLMAIGGVDGKRKGIVEVWSCKNAARPGAQ